MVIFNEKEYCERLLKEGIIRPYNKRFKDIFVLCKYYKHLGYKASDNKKKLIDFLIKYDDDFDINMNNQDLIKIHRIVQSIYKKKYHFRDKVKVSFSKSEIERIKELNSKVERKVYYTLLFLSKLYKSKFVKVDYKDIIDLAEINTYNTEYLYHQILIELENKELIIIYEDGSYLIKPFKDESNIIMTLNEFNIKDLFRQMNKSGGNCCENCGVSIIKTNNKMKYCSECKREVKLKNDREIQKIRYNSRK